MRRQVSRGASRGRNLFQMRHENDEAAANGSNGGRLQCLPVMSQVHAKRQCSAAGKPDLGNGGRELNAVCLVSILSKPCQWSQARAWLGMVRWREMGGIGRRQQESRWCRRQSFPFSTVPHVSSTLS